MQLQPANQVANCEDVLDQVLLCTSGLSIGHASCGVGLAIGTSSPEY